MKENNLEIALEQLHKALLLIVAREREAQSKCERTKNDITQNIETVFQAVREELVLDALTPFGKKFYSFKMGPLNAVLDELSASNKKEEVLDCAEVKRLYPYLLAAYYLNSANAMKKEWCLADVDDKPFLDVFGEDNLYRELKRYVSRFTLQDIFGAKTEMERIEYLQNLQKKRYWNDKGHTSLGRTQQEAVHQVFVFMLLVLCSTQYEEIIEDIDYRASFEMFQQHTAALYSEYSLSETTELDEEEQSKKEEYLMESFEKLDALKQKLGYQSEIDIEECDYEFEESEFELEEEKYTIEGCDGAVKPALQTLRIFVK